MEAPLRDFQLLEPRSPEEASRMLADHGEEARVLAGGTALLLGMRQRLVTPSHVVFLGGVPGLNVIDYDDTRGLRIGALSTITELTVSKAINAHYPMIVAMARQVANPQVRNAATLGGNLCYGDPALDPPTCLMALEARVTAIGPEGARSIDLADFYEDYFVTALRHDEVVTQIDIPRLPDDAAGAYTRFIRTPAEHRPLIGLAVVARREGGVCRDARIAIGASTPIPVRAKRAEQFLEGKKVTRDVLEEAAEITAADINPLSDSRGCAEYRRDMVRILLGRTAAAVFGIPAE
jgi:carbon-monoxide dehydrogenase medium subunit